MKLQHQTILITGGSSGIGMELAKQLIARQNTVLICGRSAEKLSAANGEIPDLHCFQCDISLESDRKKLIGWISSKHPQCNILINNAAIVHRTNFHLDDAILQKADLEIRTNLFAPIALSKALLPAFQKKKQSAIINITTGLIYAPRAIYPIYNATKAALHSFTQVLRHQLKDTNVNVIEVMMPVVATAWHQGNVPDIAISPEVAVTEMVAGIEKGKQEVKVGKVPILHFLSRLSPAFAFKKINQIR